MFYMILQVSRFLCCQIIGLLFQINNITCLDGNFQQGNKRTPTYCENILLPFYLRCNTALINPIYESLRFWSLKKLRFSATIFRVFVLFNGLNGCGKRNVNDLRFILHNYLMPTGSANVRKLKIIGAVTRRATFATSC